jgi:N-acetyl-anhydromuramyl-L-alanine amidase AmpD
VSPSSRPAPSGPIATELGDAAATAGVPTELVTAVAVEEGGLMLPAHRAPETDDMVAVAGRLELRRGKLDTLALGARLIGASQLALVADTALATRAGALVVAALGATDSPATWPAALAKLSGLGDDAAARDYAARVVDIVRRGGRFAAADDEVVELSSDPEVAEVAEVAALPRLSPRDFGGLIQVPTDCTGKCDIGRPLGNAAVDKIVIHDTEGGWDASVATLQSQSGISVHYLVDADGSRVAQFIPETDTGWHAGNYFYNETSIGIEHVGFAANTAGYAAALYATSEELVRNIAVRWSIALDREHVIGHYQVPNGNVLAKDSPPCAESLATCETDSSYGGADNHRDPGLYWDWTGFLAGLQLHPVEVATTAPGSAGSGGGDAMTAQGGCAAGGASPLGSPLALGLGLAFGLWLRRRWRRADARWLAVD